MACLPPRLVLASTAPVLVLLLFVPLSPCRAASGSSPSAVLLPVDKDGATQQYVTMFWQRTPSVPVKAVVDLAGAMLWVDCESGYESSSYARVPCGVQALPPREERRLCHRLLRCGVPGLPQRHLHRVPGVHYHARQHRRQHHHRQAVAVHHLPPHAGSARAPPRRGFCSPAVQRP